MSDTPVLPWPLGLSRVGGYKECPIADSATPTQATAAQIGTRALRFTGTLTATRSFRVPLISGIDYLIINDATYAVIIGAGSGDSVTIPAGSSTTVVCTGTGYRSVNRATLGVRSIVLPDLDVAVSDATNTTPIVFTTATPHGRSTGDYVCTSGVLGNTSANDTGQAVTVLSPTTFSIPKAGNGAYSGGGNVSPAHIFSSLEDVSQIIFSSVAPRTGDQLIILGTLPGGCRWIVVDSVSGGDLYVSASNGITGPARLTNSTSVYDVVTLPVGSSVYLGVFPIQTSGSNWTRGSGAIYPTTSADKLVLGATAAVGAERFRNVGTTRLEGDLSVVGGNVNVSGAHAQVASPHIVGAGSTPTILVNAAGAGAAGTAAISGNDHSGLITIVTDAGDVPGAGAEIAAVTFVSTYLAGPRVLIAPVNQAACALASGTVCALYGDMGQGGFKLTSGAALPALTGATYIFAYLVG